MARTNVDDQKIIEIYNREGKKAATKMIRDTYQIKYPNCVISRIRNNTAYHYNKAKDCFSMGGSNPFMDLNELCSAKVEQDSSMNADHRVSASSNSVPDPLGNLFIALMQEKLVELTKYIHLNSSDQTCRIDKTALAAAGYRMEIY